MWTANILRYVRSRPAVSETINYIALLPVRREVRQGVHAILGELSDNVEVGIRKTISPSARIMGA